MKKFNRQSVLACGFLLPLIIIVGLDVAYVFGNRDTPFILALGIYVLYVLLCKATSRSAMVIGSICVLCMGILYIAFGAGRTTERFGEWFYIFFVVGLIQYAKEAWSAKL